MQQLILLIVDESLSMRSKKFEVLNGINQFIDIQRKINSDGGRLILVKFNNNVTVLHKGTPIDLVKPLRASDYNPAGRTALFDAIHRGIGLAEEIKQPDERVVCILVTDGEDNASKHNVSCKSAKKLVKKYDIKADWSFTYIGKPTEYWCRTKPVSSISYECNTPRLVGLKHQTVTPSIQRRLRTQAPKLSNSPVSSSQSSTISGGNNRNISTGGTCRTLLCK